MSPTTGQSGGEERCRLEPVTCWPLVGASGLGLTALSLALLMLAHSTTTLPQPLPDQPSARIDPEPIEPTYLRHERASARQRPPAHVPKSSPPVAEVEAAEDARPKSWPSHDARIPRPRSADERELRESLLAASREFELDTRSGTAAELLAFAQMLLLKARPAETKRQVLDSLSAPWEKSLAARADLNGIPLLAGKACQSSEQQTNVLELVSRSVRRMQGRQPDLYEMTTHLRTACFALANDRKLLVRPLEQVFQTEAPAVRIELVNTLARITGKAATQALARRAVFDPVRCVREQAVEALQKRDRWDAREVFVAALRHPWPPAADHAALALVALKDEDAESVLRPLLAQPNPAAPYQDKDGTWRKKELVRVNHLKNCLLCHPPSIDPADGVRGPIPKPGEPLPAIYYEGDDQRVPMMRADIVYCRQDFSVMHAVEKPDRWPAQQRFDYLVQAREIPADDAEEAVRKAKRQKTYPQREAVRWALSQLGVEPVEPAPR